MTVSFLCVFNSLLPFGYTNTNNNRYVERAKEIVNSVALNDANANPLVGKLREEVRGLQELLEKREATIAEHEVTWDDAPETCSTGGVGLLFFLSRKHEYVHASIQSL